MRHDVRPGRRPLVAVVTIIAALTVAGCNDDGSSPPPGSTAPNASGDSEPISTTGDSVPAATQNIPTVPQGPPATAAGD